MRLLHRSFPATIGYFNPRIPYGMRRRSPSRWCRTGDFNPRIPYGMRLVNMSDSTDKFIFQSTHPVWDATGASGLMPSFSEFQSTHPVWDATRCLSPLPRTISISIHASRMGCDPCPATNASGFTYFNPRIPYGMRPIRTHVWSWIPEFQSTHPVWDATRCAPWASSIGGISIHASRMGCDLLVTSLSVMPRRFQSTHPVWDATIIPADNRLHP